MESRRSCSATCKCSKLVVFILIASTKIMDLKAQRMFEITLNKGLDTPIEQMPVITNSMVGVSENQSSFYPYVNNDDIDPRRSVMQFVSNDNETNQENFKYHVTIAYLKNGTWSVFCGGVLISDHHVLTSGRCILSSAVNSKSVGVFVGIRDLKAGLVGNPGSQFSLVKTFRDHPGRNNNWGWYTYDITVLYLDTPISTNDFVGFATLATTSQRKEFEGTHCISSAFWSDFKLHAEVNYIPTHQDCRLLWAPAKRVRITTRQICGTKPPFANCADHVGNPMSCGESVVGILSFINLGCTDCFPLVYIRVSYFYEWIQKVIQ